MPADLISDSLHDALGHTRKRVHRSNSFRPSQRFSSNKLQPLDASTYVQQYPGIAFCNLRNGVSEAN